MAVSRSPHLRPAVLSARLTSRLVCGPVLLRGLRFCLLLPSPRVRPAWVELLGRRARVACRRAAQVAGGNRHLSRPRSRRRRVLLLPAITHRGRPSEVDAGVKDSSCGCGSSTQLALGPPSSRSDNTDHPTTISMSLPASLEDLITAKLGELSLQNDPATVEFVLQLVEEDSFEPEVRSRNPCFTPPGSKHPLSHRTRKARSSACSKQTRTVRRSASRNGPGAQTRSIAEDVGRAVGELLEAAQDYRDQADEKAREEEAARAEEKAKGASSATVFG